MFSFLFANYLAGLLNAVPTTVISFVVANILGEEMTVYYYVAKMR
jgi:hypothetical protein